MTELSCEIDPLKLPSIIVIYTVKVVVRVQDSEIGYGLVSMGETEQDVFEEEEWDFSAVIKSLNHCIALWLHVNCNEFSGFSLSVLSRDCRVSFFS